MTDSHFNLPKPYPCNRGINLKKKILGDSPRLKVTREIALAHHEYLDGSSYPYNLKGEEISLAGSIVKVAGVYDALRSKRSYKQPLSHGEALKVFKEGDDRINPKAHFDPGLLTTFFQIEHIFEKIYGSMEEERQAEG